MTDLRLAALRVPGGADPWRALGFTVVADTIGLGNGAIRVGAAQCSLELASAGHDVATRDVDTVDGVAVTFGAGADCVAHPNGAVELDHIVVMTDVVERTSALIEEVLGLEQRRLRETETVRQAFHRFAAAPDGARGCIVEVVERPARPGAAIWGVVVIVDDIDRTVAESSGRIGAPKAAVQRGRRIASVRRTAGLPLAVAVMSR